MSENKYAKATEKALGAKKTRTKKAPTKHQLELAEKAKGLEALANVDVPAHPEVEAVAEPEATEAVAEPVVEVAPETTEAVELTPIEAGLAFMKSHPRWADIMKAADLEEKAQKAEQDAISAEKDFETLKTKGAAHALKLVPLQREYEDAFSAEKDAILGDPDITFKRALRSLLKGQFSKLVEDAARVAMSKKPAIVEMQSRLAALTAEAEQLRTAKEAAAKRASTNHELSVKLMKEANALIASIQL